MAGQDTRAWNHDIPEGPWDYIVIGTGIGGMAAAAVLSKIGKRVLVLEQHNIPGGFTQTFKRPGYRWDVGVHLIGEMTERNYPGRLMKSLTNGQLEWEPVGEIYDEFNFPDGFTIQFPNSREAFRETLVDHFPEERQAIDSYLALVKAAALSAAKLLQTRAMPKLLPSGSKKKVERAAAPHVAATTDEVLRSLTDDAHLRSVLAAQWGYYGVTPVRSSFAMHALMVQHFMHGAYYPVGTAASIAPAMLDTVTEAGGWTAVRRSVGRIIMRSGRVAGVRLDDGTEIGSKRVISTAGALPTSAMLEDGLPGADKSDWEAGPAHLSLYLGFKGDVAANGAKRYCQWFYESWDMERSHWAISPDEEPGRADVLFCSFPSIKDPAHDPGVDSKHTGEIVTFVPWEVFGRWEGSKWKKRGADYDAFKRTLAERMLDQYGEHYPGLIGMVDHAELSTPLSTNHFARSPRGSIYGLEPTPGRFQDTSLGPRTSVKGLYLGGVDVSTPGVTGGLIGGVLAAMAAEPVRVARFLQPIMKRPTM
ncbi:MAG: NAD(P)/FAD-dependent oxidoreductase [bacterium]|nr:NAD(P)/FAD-dependent oxidoreductase [bacterium]